MHRPRLGLLCLCALALCPLVAPGSAQAAATSGFKASLAAAPEAKTAAELPAQVLGELEGADGTLLTRLVGLAASVLCTTSSLEGVKLEGEGKLTEGSKVTFTGCTVPTPTGCMVNSPGKAIGTIATNELKGQLQSSGEIKVEPKTTGGAFANLVFGHETGKTCSLPEEVSEPIKGVLWLKDCEGKIEEHLEKHLLVESTAHSKTLFIGSDTAKSLETSLDGSAWAKLGGAHAGLKWGGELSIPEWIMLVV